MCGNEEPVTAGSPYQPWLEKHREEAALPAWVDAHSRRCWRPEAMPLPSPLSSLLQLPKTMEGTASWLRGCFLAVGTVDSSGAAAASHGPEDMDDTEA